MAGDIAQTSHPTTSRVKFGPSFQICGTCAQKSPQTCYEWGLGFAARFGLSGEALSWKFGVQIRRMNFRICRMNFRVNFLGNAPRTAENSREKFTRYSPPRKIHAKNSRAKFTRKIHAQNSRARFTRKHHIQNSRAKFTRKISAQH